jgi:hypothetical protein
MLIHKLLLSKIRYLNARRGHAAQNACGQAAALINLTAIAGTSGELQEDRPAAGSTHAVTIEV